MFKPEMANSRSPSNDRNVEASHNTLKNTNLSMHIRIKVITILLFITTTLEIKVQSHKEIKLSIYKFLNDLLLTTHFLLRAGPVLVLLRGRLN